MSKTVLNHRGVEITPTFNIPQNFHVNYTKLTGTLFQYSLTEGGPVEFDKSIEDCKDSINTFLFRRCRWCDEEALPARPLCREHTDEKT